MGAVAFADLDILSDTELVTWWLKVFDNDINNEWMQLIVWTYSAPPVIFDLRSCKDRDFFFDLHTN